VGRVIHRPINLDGHEEDGQEGYLGLKAETFLFEIKNSKRID